MSQSNNHIPPSASVAALHLLPKGTCARIVEIVTQLEFGAEDHQVTQRLKELGFLAGAQIKVIGFGLFGKDPIAVQINGTKFGLRRREAEKIMTQPQPV